ncbi:NAD-dependent epimerase/dehydratase family protein [Patescibacteria group bacterium]|nr:NAD-dependent epimerase/dehydratase family protein [Patescibacteria group bacterium]
MSIAIITGSAGLIGSEASKFFCSQGLSVVGIDNDMRKYFFGAEASTNWMAQQLKSEFSNYISEDVDIRDYESIKKIFQKYEKDIKLVIHTAAQPSHDWAAKEPFTDFTINANGTLNLLEAVRNYCPKSTFIFTSTNKVYGDTPNDLPLVEQDFRWEIENSHKYYKNGIDETMSIDNSKHSLFGASKVAADILTQEYGKYFGINTAIFRGGCLTGPNHAGAQLHGFLSYLMKCAMSKQTYYIFGYQGKQVRDNIHSQDLINCFYNFYKDPRSAEVYNIGGSRFSNCSILEAISLCEEITGNKMSVEYKSTNRSGDHIWWISDVSKFKKHYPKWKLTKNVKDILVDIYQNNTMRFTC